MMSLQGQENAGVLRVGLLRRLRVVRFALFCSPLTSAEWLLGLLNLQLEPLHGLLEATDGGHKVVFLL